MNSQPIVAAVEGVVAAAGSGAVLLTAQRTDFAGLADIIDRIGFAAAFGIGTLVVLWRLISPIARAQASFVQSAQEVNELNARTNADQGRAISALATQVGELVRLNRDMLAELRATSRRGDG